MKLRFMNIWNFSKLIKLSDLDNRTMVVLEEFYVQHCLLVNNVPKGIECLKKKKLRKFFYIGYAGDGLDKDEDFWDHVRARIKV